MKNVEVDHTNISSKGVLVVSDIKYISNNKSNFGAINLLKYQKYKK